MPAVGLLIGGIDFKDWFVTLKDGATTGPYATLGAAKEAGAVTMNLGILINAIISFLIVAFVVFLLVKQINRLKREEPVKTVPGKPGEDVLLLREIRDSLKK